MKGNLYEEIGTRNWQTFIMFLQSVDSLIDRSTTMLACNINGGRCWLELILVASAAWSAGRRRRSRGQSAHTLTLR